MECFRWVKEECQLQLLCCDDKSVEDGHDFNGECCSTNNQEALETKTEMLNRVHNRVERVAEEILFLWGISSNLSLVTVSFCSGCKFR